MLGLAFRRGGMMASRAAAMRRPVVGGSRQLSTQPDALRTLYQNVFKSNIAYLTYVFAGAIALEAIYSKGIDAAWELNNRGKLYHHIDWSKWHFHLDEEEEEEEEE